MPFESYGRNIIGDKLSGRSRKTFLKRICGKDFTNTEKAGVGKGVGCSILDTAINNEELLNEVINTILIFSIVISLLSCNNSESYIPVPPKIPISAVSSVISIAPMRLFCICLIPWIHSVQSVQ